MKLNKEVNCIELNWLLFSCRVPSVHWQHHRRVHRYLRPLGPLHVHERLLSRLLLVSTVLLTLLGCRKICFNTCSILFAVCAAFFRRGSREGGGDVFSSLGHRNFKIQSNQCSSKKKVDLPSPHHSNKILLQREWRRKDVFKFGTSKH